MSVVNGLDASSEMQAEVHALLRGMFGKRMSDTMRRTCSRLFHGPTPAKALPHVYHARLHASCSVMRWYTLKPPSQRGVGHELRFCQLLLIHGSLHVILFLALPHMVATLLPVAEHDPGSQPKRCALCCMNVCMWAHSFSM